MIDVTIASPEWAIHLRDLFYNLFMLFMSLSLFLVLSRLKEGPSLADRVVVIDLFSAILLTAVSFAAILSDDVFGFDIAIVLSLFSFLGTVFLARFIYQQASKAKGNET